MEAPKIQRTNDYDMFKFVNFNREKNRRHVENIKEILKKENLLHLHPILINNDMEVVDGQHRLQAAKELGLDIFYIKDTVSYEHILNSNLYQKKLTFSDILHFFAKKEKNVHYQKAIDLMRLMELQPKAFFSLVMAMTIGKINELVKEGKFEMPEDQEFVNKLTDSYLQFTNYCKDMRVTPYSMFRSAYFTRAFRNIMLCPEFDITTFIKKLEVKRFDLRPQPNSTYWFKSLVKIFNFKNQNPIVILDSDMENE